MEEDAAIMMIVAAASQHVLAVDASSAAKTFPAMKTGPLAFMVFARSVKMMFNVRKMDITAATRISIFARTRNIKMSVLSR